MNYDDKNIKSTGNAVSQNASHQTKHKQSWWSTYVTILNFSLNCGHDWTISKQGAVIVWKSTFRTEIMISNRDSKNHSGIAHSNNHQSVRWSQFAPHSMNFGSAQYVWAEVYLSISMSATTRQSDPLFVRHSQPPDHRFFNHMVKTTVTYHHGEKIQILRSQVFVFETWRWYFADFSPWW